MHPHMNMNTYMFAESWEYGCIYVNNSTKHTVWRYCNDFIDSPPTDEIPPKEACISALGTAFTHIAHQLRNEETKISEVALRHTNSGKQRFTMPCNILAFIGTDNAFGCCFMDWANNLKHPQTKPIWSRSIEARLWLAVRITLGGGKHSAGTAFGQEWSRL